MLAFLLRFGDNGPADDEDREVDDSEAGVEDAKGDEADESDNGSEGFAAAVDIGDGLDSGGAKFLASIIDHIQYPKCKYAYISFPPLFNVKYTGRSYLLNDVDLELTKPASLLSLLSPTSWNRASTIR
jgi:hypothetical protein